MEHLPPPALPAPFVPHGQRSPGGAGGSGVRRGTALLVSHQCQIWEIAVFSLLTSDPEARRGGEVRGARCLSAGRPGSGGGTRPAWQSKKIGAGARRPRPATAASLGAWGEPRASRVGLLWLLFMRSWKLLGESFIFTRTLKVIVASAGKGTLASAWEARMQPCKMCH